MTTQNPATDQPKPGIYKGRVMSGKEQHGESSNSTPELLLMVNVPDLGRQFTVPLYFSQAAAPYSFERLRACGWKGKSALDLEDMTGVGDNDIDIEIKYEMYEGSLKMKVSIMSGGGGRFNTSNPMDKKSFAAKVAAITGQGAGGNGAPPPPF